MAAYKELLKKFAKGKSKVCVRVDQKDCYNMNRLFKTHRHFIEWLFQQKGLEVVRHAHVYNDDDSIKEPGLIYAMSDSNIDPHMEVWGIVDVSVKSIGVVDGDAAGN